MKNIDFSLRSVQITTLIFLSLIWGSSFILMKRGLEAFSPQEVTALRLFLVFIVLLPSTIKHFKVLNRSNRWIFLAVGILGSALPHYLFVAAQTEISSSLSGILNSLTPLFALIFAIVFFSERIGASSIAGVLLGLIGSIGLIYFSSEHEIAQKFTVYMLLPIIASACYGLNVNIIKLKLKDVDPVAVTVLSFALIGPFAGVYLLEGSDFITHIQEPNGLKSFGFIAILAIIGTAMAVLIFNMLIKETTALFASSVTYLIPMVAITWGLIDGEKFNLIQLLFSIMILAGISLIKSKKSESC